ncbi:hypothetical protein Tco_0098804 [Tanacetum coccineum]
MIEPVEPIKKKDLIRLDKEVDLKLQAKFDEEEILAREKAKKVEEANIALIETWDDIQAKIDADHQLAERLLVQEQEELSVEEKATLFQQQKVEDEKETTEIKKLMEIIPGEEEVAIDAIPLAIKSPSTYVSHPSTEEVKAKLDKIIDNPILLDRTPVLTTTFHVAWRILFTFVVQVQRFVSCALAALLGPDYTQDESFRISPTILSNSNFSKDPSKVTLIELTDFMVAGLEAPGSLPQKRKKPKSKKTPTKTKRNHTELAVRDCLPRLSGGGTHKSQPLSEGKKSNPKDSVGNIQPINIGLPSTSSDEGAAKTTLLSEGPCGDED